MSTDAKPQFKFKKIHKTEEEKILEKEKQKEVKQKKKIKEKQKKEELKVKKAEEKKEQKKQDKIANRGGLVSTAVSKTTYSIEEIEAAIRKTGGYLLHTAEELKCPIATLKKAIDASATLKKAWFETRESCLDIAESKLMEQVEAGNMLALMFYLKCQGKSRGWVEKPEGKTGGSADKPLYIKIMPIDSDGNSLSEPKNGRPKKMFEEKKVIAEEISQAALAGIKDENIIDVEFNNI